MSETSQGLHTGIEYNTDLFEASTISRMLDHWQQLLLGVAAHPEWSILDLPLLTEAEHHSLIVEWNQTAAAFPAHECLHTLFEQQVERTPQAVALVYQDVHITYEALNCQANQLAHYLHSCGVGPDVFVGICVQRSPQMPVGLLGILKAGGAYVPLDPTYPEERLAFMLHDAQIHVLLTQEQLLEYRKN